MARKGRKRKAGPRFKCGQRKANHVPKVERAPEAIVMSQPHRNWLPPDIRKDQLAECELGRLYLAGALRSPYAKPPEAPEMARGRLWAGQRYQRLMAAFLAALAAPKTPGSAGFANVTDSFSADDAKETKLDRLGHLILTEDEEERFARLTAEVNNVTAWLRVFHDAHLLRQTLDAVCLQDKAIGAHDLPLLRTALDALARKWNLFEDRVKRSHAYRSEPFSVDEAIHERVQA